MKSPFRLSALLVLSAMCLTAHAGELPAVLTLSFSRTMTRQGVAESISATAYYRASPSFFCLEIREPAPQLVFFSRLDTLSWYPESRKALRLEFSEPQAISLQTELETLFSKDKGLSAAGYRFDRVGKGENGVESVWIPPASLSGSIRETRVTTDDANHVVSMVSFGPTGLTVQETVYGGYASRSSTLPSTAVTRMYLPDGSTAMETRFTVISSDTASPIPERLESFSVPEGVITEVLKW